MNQQAIAEYVRRHPLDWPPMTAEQREKAVAILARPTARRPAPRVRRDAA